MAALHLVKLSVGTESVDDLADWQRSGRAVTAEDDPRHVTRMFPRRGDEILAGGSIYWVIRGVVLCRQRILRFDELDRGDGIRRCAIVLDRALVRTVPTPRRPFQGWRYLPAAEAPRDLPAGREAEAALPPALEAVLAEIGVL